MDVYVFAYHVKPTEGSPEYSTVGGAHADIWVYDSSRDSAEAKALSHLIDLAWQVIEAECELVITDMQIAHYRADAQANYSQAKAHGISSFFAAYPPTEDSRDYVEIRPIKSPPISSPTKH